MVTPGRYVYGLIRIAEDLDYGCIGLEHDGKPGRVATLRIDSVGAVVSDYAARDKVLPVRKNLEPHHRGIREVMKATTIIPMTFGHVAKNAAAVERTLRENRDEIEEELDRVDGKVEMGLKVQWDVDNIFEYFIGADPGLAALRDEIFGRSRAPVPAEKIELGRRFEQRLNQEREDQTDRVVEAFRPYFSELKVNPPKNEKIVMDLAFLVERGRLKPFEEQVYQVAGLFPTQYLFDYGGPWAPFNFAELDLRAAAA
ncbi:MAG TPA: GvpL/GvpF family gas vesicle protein [Thermoanaerobaculia bacterium]|nr:GvpL/GvpF family gas vesicle protein [Thermoanaerobaculia bacterium]